MNFDGSKEKDVTSVVMNRPVRAPAGPPPRFVQLCKTLYGDGIDAAVIWADVAKSGPDQADLHANTGVGTLRPKGKLLATGASVPPPTAAAAAIALANKKKLAAAAQPTGSGYLVPTAVVDKALINLPKIVAGSRKLMDDVVGAWKAPEALNGLKAPKIKPTAAAAPTVQQPILPGLAGQQALKPKPGKLDNAASALGSTLSSKEGKIGIGLGTGATLGVGAIKNSRSQRMSTAGGDYAKRAKPEREFVAKGVFTEIDEDQHLAFGWASVTEMNGSPVVDKQDDYIDTEEIAKAAYDYVHDSRVGGDMHRRNGAVPHKVSDLIESMVFTDDKIEKMGLPDDFPRGWWVGFKIHDEPTWQMVKNRERTGFSIHGTGARVETSLDDIMGYVA